MSVQTLRSGELRDVPALASLAATLFDRRSIGAEGGEAYKDLRIASTTGSFASPTFFKCRYASVP